MDINDLRQKRAKAAADARALMDTAQAAGRALTGEEERQFDAHMDDADGFERTIKREEKLRAQERALGERAPDNAGAGADDDNNDENAARDKAFRAYLVGGARSLTADQARALNASNDPEGGYLVAPQQWVAQLIQNIDDEVPFRALATVMQLTEGESLGVPTLDTDLTDAEWTSEIGTGSQDDSLKFGKREFRPNPLAKRVKISRTLLRRAASMSPETIVRERMAYKFAVAAEKAYMVGDGNKKPLGVFTASADGISTGRDVSIGAAGAIPLTPATGDQLITAKYTLKSKYWRSAQWLYHRDMIATVRKVKDNDGQYQWQPGLSGTPDTLLELPLTASEFAPNTVAANNYVGLLGDFTHYWIADALDMDIQRLNELYAETNQVGYIGRLESDGMPVLEEAFVRLKVPA
ncbi:MAG TPA: phage major capsid protein [Actinokineospora sp.]|nr:phage major capsid protein [Actinokineospora sp.]